jgi:hypothetical protein
VRPMATHQNTGLYGPGDADGEDNSQNRLLFQPATQGEATQAKAESKTLARTTAGCG